METEEELQAVLAAFPELLLTQREPVVLSFDGKYLITFHLGESYPAEVPEVMIKVPWLSSERETEIAARARSQCTPGEPMLFSLVSLIQAEVPHEPSMPAPLRTVGIHPMLITSDKELAFGTPQPKPHSSPVLKDSPVEETRDLFGAKFISGPVITDRKSSFQAHIAKIESVEEVPNLLSLVKAHRKVGKATHNMWAYALSQGNCEFEDDGVRPTQEGGAGQRLMQVVQQSGAANVLVVVSRWYGGINLGSDRFKHIMRAAWELLRAQGFCGVKGGK